MHAQNFASEKKVSTQEQIEARAFPPKEMARQMLRDADKQITSAKSTIEDIRQDMKELGESDPVVAEQLAQLEADLDFGWDDLQSDLAEITEAPPESVVREKAPAKEAEKPAESIEDDFDWEIPEEAEGKEEMTEEMTRVALEEKYEAALEGKQIDASFDTLAATEIGRVMIHDRVQENIFNTLLKNKVDFESFEKLAQMATVSVEVRASVTEQLVDFIGKKFAERLTSDQEFRRTLAEIQESISGTLGEDGPEMCSQSDIKKLIVAHEVFGKNIREVALASNLAAYSSELQINTQETKSIIYIMDPTFDEETGECEGSVGVAYSYGEKNSGGRIERTFSRVKKSKDTEGEIYERVANLDLIQLPDSLKGNNVAALEYQKREQELSKSGFDSMTLHANIDIGGYAWAAKGFGWDFNQMRRAGEEQKPEEEIVSEFITERLEHLKQQLIDSDIDLTESSVKAIIEEYEQCAANSLAVTPQKLAQIGRNGPLFVQAESGRYYPQESYSEEMQKNDPPRKEVKGGLHAGKIFLIGSDWYGKKPITKSE